VAERAAILACLILALLAVLQVALALGAPLGRFAWGGRHDRLPRGLRLASAASVVLYGVFAAIALERAGVIAPLDNAGAVGVMTWGLAAYFTLGIAANTASRSRSERRLMAPAAAALAVLFAVLALTGP
jgi:hypothetical protein